MFNLIIGMPQYFLFTRPLKQINNVWELIIYERLLSSYQIIEIYYLAKLQHTLS